MIAVPGTRYIYCAVQLWQKFEISRAQKVTYSEVSDTPQAEGPRLFSPELQSSALNSVLSQRKNFILQPSPLSHAQKLFEKENHQPYETKMTSAKKK